MLDIRTLFIVVSALSILSAVVIYALYRFRLPMQGPLWWAVGSFSLSVGLSLTAARGAVPLFLSVVVGNALVLWYYVLTINGMHIFLGRSPFLTRSRLGAAVFLTLAYALFMHWFSAVEPNLNARIIATSLLAGLLALYTGVLLIRHGRRMFGALFFAGWMIAHSLGDLIRIVMVGATPGLNDFMHSGPVNGYYLAFVVLVVIGTAFGMVLMISEELNERVQRQNDVLEENIRLRDEMEAITQHDLRSPISPIVSLSELLLLTPGLSREAELYVREVRRAAQTALETLDRSLDLYKLENGQYRLTPETVDIGEMVRELVQQLETETGIRSGVVRVRIDGKPSISGAQCRMRGDGVLLRSMLLNLLKNAVEASGGEGHVDVELSAAPESVRITLVNDGVVDASVRDSFFQKFSTFGKQTGTGLGTYSARLIAEAHGGTVEVDFSRPGKTAVHVTFPPNGVV